MTNAVDAKADMKTTSDLPDDTTEPTSGGLDLFQGLFWLSLMIAVVAACVAIIIPDAVGQTGRSASVV